MSTENPTGAVKAAQILPGEPSQTEAVRYAPQMIATSQIPAVSQNRPPLCLNPQQPRVFERPAVQPDDAPMDAAPQPMPVPMAVAAPMSAPTAAVVPMPAAAPFAYPASALFSPQQAQKRALRRVAFYSGLALVLSFALQFFVGIAGGMLLMALEMLLPGGAGMTGKQWSSIITVVAYVISYGVPIVILCAALRQPLRDCLWLRKSRPLYQFTTGPAVLGMAVLGILFDFLLTMALQAVGITQSYDMLQPASFGGGDLVLYFVTLAILPAFLEEFLFRGALLRMLRPFGDRFAVVCTAVLFGLMHGNLTQAPTAFLIGLVLGVLTLRSGSIWPAVGAHFLNNALATVVNLTLMTLPPRFQTVASLGVHVLYLFVGLLGLWILLRRDRALLQIPKSDSALPLGRRTAGLLLHPWMLCFLLIALWLIVTTLHF